MGAWLLSIQVSWMGAPMNASHRLHCHVRKLSLPFRTPQLSLLAPECPELPNRPPFWTGEVMALPGPKTSMSPPGCSALSMQLPCPQQCPHSHPGL